MVRDARRLWPPLCCAFVIGALCPVARAEDLGGTRDIRAEARTPPLAGARLSLSPVLGHSARVSTPGKSPAFQYLGGPIGPYRGSGQFGPPAALRPVVPTWNVRFRTRARHFSVAVSGSNHEAVRLSVDGAAGRVIRMPRQYGMHLLRVHLTHPARKSIRLELEAGELFGGVDAPAPVRRSTARVGPRTILVGDSYAAGRGARARFTSLSQVLAGELGLGDLWASAAGGTGYVTAVHDPGFRAPSFQGRLQRDVIRRHPRTVLFAGGINDAFVTHATRSQEFSAALSVFRRTRSALPHARIVVIGPWVPSGHIDEYPQLPDIRLAIRDAAAQAHVPFVDTLGFISGTGNVKRPRHDGNADTYIDATGHPTPAGHAYLGRRLSAAIKHL